MTGAPFAEALAEVAAALEHLGIRYFVAGSVASVFHGEIRTTHDVDIVVELSPEHVGPLVTALSPQFFVDEVLLRETVAHRSSCNVIHRSSGFKVDLFQLRDREFSRREMERSQVLLLLPAVPLSVASAEDCILTKLEWYEKGGRVSDRQWRDVMGVLKAQRGGLDLDYLRHWAGVLCISELLDRAMGEAGVRDG